MVNTRIMTLVAILALVGVALPIVSTEVSAQENMTENMTEGATASNMTDESLNWLARFGETSG